MTRTSGDSVTFSLTYHPDVKEVDLPRINVKMRERIRRAIESRLMTEPQEYGLPLRKNLGGYWRLRVGDSRVVFKIEGEVLYVLGTRHRKCIYEDVPARRMKGNLHPPSLSVWPGKTGSIFMCNARD